MRVRVWYLNDVNVKGDKRKQKNAKLENNRHLKKKEFASLLSALKMLN